MGGGINTLGNLTIDRGTYNITAVGGESTDSSSAVGILTGYNDGDNIVAGDLTINRDATSLYLEPFVAKTFEKTHQSSANPKTGADTRTSDVAVAGVTLLLLIGNVYVLSLREDKASLQR
ncbi:hypothetical protein [Acetobacterium woodii]|uniref:Gram-positive cocci surface proteins LPxTG domain-containing protein n=1 Tax=Acetobacterium woodii (strain ATCC 29683 / DSM 1030 / JCM 2381 / KCTC 1655 / WB1) TaxID=931626 RepID=H6LGM9_ACEWD|nr:hypothetical protein [Acetobacterium woodii]AFA48357.1 hypothetical protein Awo_c15750 [Acetobacterium woodii DSM 1030]